MAGTPGLAMGKMSGFLHLRCFRHYGTGILHARVFDITPHDETPEDGWARIKPSGRKLQHCICEMD